MPSHNVDVAVMRGVPDSITRCELTHLDREPIDLDRALAQHAAYAALLVELGLEVGTRTVNMKGITDAAEVFIIVPVRAP